MTINVNQVTGLIRVYTPSELPTTYSRETRSFAGYPCSARTTLFSLYWYKRHSLAHKIPHKQDCADVKKVKHNSLTCFGTKWSLGIIQGRDRVLHAAYINTCWRTSIQDVLFLWNVFVPPCSNFHCLTHTKDSAHNFNPITGYEQRASSCVEMKPVLL